MIETYTAFFGGERRMAINGETLEAHNPATGDLIGRFPRCGPEDVDAAVESAMTAFSGWREMHPSERAACLLQLAERVEADRDRLLLLDVRDNGSPISEMAVDIVVGVKQLRYFAGMALETRGATMPTGHNRLNFTLRQPFGVCAQLLAFNHPLMFALKTIGAPLVAGNTVIIKPSEYTSLSTLALADHLEACFPPGVVSILPGLGSEAGDALVGHPKVRRVHFIGGEATGRRIQARAANVAVKNVTLELGGKNPLVIWPDADLSAAIDGTIRGMRFNFQGQACGSTSRLLLPHGLKADFLDAVGERMRELRVGLPEDPSTQVGSLVHAGHMTRVLHYIDMGVRDGGRVLTGGTRLTHGALDKGFFVPPTLIADVAQDSDLLRDEIFGPVLTSQTYDGYEQAIALANDSRFGLTASIYTRDLGVAHRFARDVEAGYIWVNDNQSHFLGAPYGGNKDSGIGREEDGSELLSYTEIKNVNFRFE
ncbi:aldehyde dehydrogenase family protein [Sphingobium sp. CAP-1]|uniref:aldehyde dehydrogenase family protein n=1 Tax=Sphingobium sp. CAP-1 TaxID=2676077 RepID=UPI0012BB28C3|nr:aldehyde dehydrogenase family protein [Sphingobium sp. CAP-1]QGP80451.1 aldehyde dehydrogenase family protein [Sphingobium sp. CAP-1]